MADQSRRNWLRNSLLASSALFVGGSRPLMGRPLADSLDNFNGTLRLNWNENPFGPSPNAIKAVTDVVTTSNRYPDAMINELRICLPLIMG